MPVGLAVVAFALAYVRFVWKLPEPTRSLIVVSGIVDVAGALGGELLEGIYFTRAARTAPSRC